FLSLAVGTGIHWWMAASAFKQTLDRINHREIIPGVRMDFGKKTISGFPFRMDVLFEDFSLSGEGAHGSFRWRSPTFALHSLAYGRTQDIFEAAGEQDLSWHDRDGSQRHVRFLPGTLRASAIADTRGLSRFDLDLRAAAGETFRAGRLQLHVRRDPDGKDMD